MSAPNSGPFSRFLSALNPFRSGDPADRRRAVRMQSNRISCSIGEIVDLSATGARVRCRRFFRPMQGKPVSLSIDCEGTPISIGGTVCWTAEEYGAWYAGIAFTELSETHARALGDLIARGGAAAGYADAA